MSPSTIAIIILSSLGLLVLYAFIYQLVDKRRKHRQRLLVALKHRQRLFKHMLVSFPPGFLTKELNLLVYRALIDCCEQLSRLEPKISSHKAEMTRYSREMEAVRQKQEPPRETLGSPERISAARRQIQELYRYVHQQAEHRNMGRSQAQSYLDQIKRLAIQMSVDGNIMTAKQAQGVGKTRLALHYFLLARKALEKTTGSIRDHQQQVSHLDNVIGQLEAQLEQEAQKNRAVKKHEAPPDNKEWEQFEEGEEGWKKKQVYD